ncbi:hypothetical protein [Streptomyces massasporeus]|uniref:hypothetical protein n=1 Tax=Streptomyces massasporeus TaxID=67324 RepID=UPI003830A851
MVHPGGPRIIAEVTAALGLGTENSRHSFASLEENGNLGGNAVLDVLGRRRPGGGRRGGHRADDPSAHRPGAGRSRGAGPGRAARHALARRGGAQAGRTGEEDVVVPRPRSPVPLRPAGDRAASRTPRFPAALGAVWEDRSL